MYISEIFYSIQGEGPQIGHPAIFLRLSGCHLRCTWCDSKFTWPLKSANNLSIKGIYRKISGFPAKHLVITGGEPLIQQKELRGFLEFLRQKGNYFVEMETSGSIKSNLGKLIDQYNCSPKLTNSGNSPYRLQKFPDKKTYYKFVVNKQKDISEIKKFIQKNHLCKEKIILMPQGIKKKELSAKMVWLAKICKKENFRLSPRLHIDIWGNKRGV